MNINFKTSVPGNFEKVFQAFDQKLFAYLLPAPARLLRFDGSKKGDIVHIQFPLNQNWISTITAQKQFADYHFFIDEGTTLPFGLKFWRHTHIVHRDGDNAIIEDDISFSTGVKALDLVFYPGLYASFYPRKKQYKAYFKNLKQHT